jgi:G6PDH family F420-dependent oxidoreductase
VKIGYALLAEQSGPAELVRHAVRGEAAGFDFEMISDAFSPWLAAQGHAPNTWPVLGASAATSRRVELMTFATSPVGRYHPAVVAQLAGTVGLLCEGRFTLGLGLGDSVSDAAFGQGWPSQAARMEMLGEALTIIEGLLRGRRVDFAGRHFRVEGAQLWDVPQPCPAVGLVVSDAASAAFAGRRADAMLATEPDAELVGLFEDGGGLGAPRIGQLAVSYGADAGAALARAHDQFRWRALGPPGAAHAPDPDAVARATRFIRPDDVAEAIPHGPDVGTYVAAVRRFADAGFSHLAIANVAGDRQDEFLDWAQDALLPALREAGAIEPA